MSKIKAAITDGFGNLGNKVQHAAVVGTAIAINKTKNDGPTIAKFAIAKAIKGGIGVKKNSMVDMEGYPLSGGIPRSR